MSSEPVTDFEMQKDYQNEPKLNGVYSTNNLPKLNDEAYVTNLNDYKSIGTHWIDCMGNGGKPIPKEIKKVVGNKNNAIYIFEILAYNSIMCRYFCIGFIDFM